MQYNHISFDLQDGVAVLTLNRPQNYNALIPAMFDELEAALDLLDSDKPAARCLLITGAGRGFCAGADLVEGIAPDPVNPPDLGKVITKYYAPLIKRLTYLPIPVVAAVNGAAAGAGMSLALACDVVIAARSAVFLQAFVNIGLIPDAGSTYMLPRLIGKARAFQLTMLGEKLSAEKAEDWGLIYKCVDDDKLMEEAMKIAFKFAKGPTKALSLMRRALAMSEGNSLNEQLDLEADLQRIAGFSKDFYEGVAGFTEKRAPRFTGE
jgi:2-(1,2-epoxy-1,2-dihydrophenyl)acetyl-CoA isomerase